MSAENHLLTRVKALLMTDGFAQKAAWCPPAGRGAEAVAVDQNHTCAAWCLLQTQEPRTKIPQRSTSVPTFAQLS